MSPYLPSSTNFIDSLISEIASIRSSPRSDVTRDRDPPRLSTAPQEQAPNVLAALSIRELARIKPIILTLHCLFPNDFLPALDILDRKLVHRLVHADTPNTVVPAPGSKPTAKQSKETNTMSDQEHVSAGEDIFLVTSASTGPSSATRTSTHDQEKGYEVRLQSWNCSCPTFAISAFRDLASRLELSPHPVQEGPCHDDETVMYPFGGTLPCSTDRNSPPVCKHILACVLFARCPELFGGHGDGDGRRVSTEELAGWCAGWGG